MQSSSALTTITCAALAAIGCSSEIKSQGPLSLRSPSDGISSNSANGDDELTLYRSYRLARARFGHYQQPSQAGAASPSPDSTAPTAPTTTTSAPIAQAQMVPPTTTTPSASSQPSAPSSASQPPQPATPTTSSSPSTTSNSPNPSTTSNSPSPSTTSNSPSPSTTSANPSSSGSGSTADTGAAFPGGFIENAASTAVRPRLTQAQLQALPAAGGSFVFPPPYNTEAVRLTDANDCGGKDCVRYVGYAYWRNINNHVGQDTMLIVLGFDMNTGGAGLSVLRYNKVSGQLDSLGAIFQGTAINPNSTGEDIYFSATRPTTIYVANGTQLLRFDVMTKETEVAFDAGPKYGSNTYLWQHNTSDNDLVHSATLRDNATGNVLGCVVYREDNGDSKLFPPMSSDFDECQIDKSGDWLLIKDNIDGKNGEDNRIINTKDWSETDLLDENGAGGHSDNGYGLMVAEDNWNQLPGAVRAWRFGQNPLTGPVVYHEPAWRSDGDSHISHTNARPGLSPDQEVVCDSTSSRGSYTRGSEIFCYKLDTSLDVMVVAPVMTDLDAAGGGTDDYSKAPKGNLDITGRYFIWTDNMGGDRLDAFLVKVPSLLGAN